MTDCFSNKAAFALVVFHYCLSMCNVLYEHHNIGVCNKVVQINNVFSISLKRTHTTPDDAPASDEIMSNEKKLSE